jgi:hypothetical protein
MHCLKYLMLGLLIIAALVYLIAATIYICWPWPCQ